MRYKIPAHIQIINTSDNDAAGNAASFLVADVLNERQFYINPTIKNFIEKFAAPKSFKDVMLEIAAEINASADDIRKHIQPFFKYIKRRHFIVPENYVAETKPLAPFLNPYAIIDNYKIEEVLSVNGDTDTYKAIDLSDKSLVIIKLLKRAKEEDAYELKKEFYFLKTLEPFNVSAKGFALNTKESCVYFVQEFIDGLSLPQFIHRRKNSTLPLIKNIISSILSSFKKIHTENIVHGDIHPSNFIVTNSNDIKVVDFGLAVNNIHNNEVTHFGGAYFFMPPERIKTTTRNKFTRRPNFYSDVFQLGVVLYVLLYNKYPFNGITWEELATEIKEKQIEFPATSQYGFMVPEYLKNIIAICVSKKPKQRFVNADELYDAFSKI